MKKFLNLKIIIPAVVGLLFVSMILYILFAPETWWKPIYIKFDAETASADTATPEGETASAETGHSAAAQLPGATTAEEAAVSHSPKLIMPSIQPGQGVMYNLDPKVVNLAEPGGLRYLQATLVLEFHPSVKEYYETKVHDEAAADAESSHAAEGEAAAPDVFQEAIDTMRPVIDDIVTTVLSSQTYNSVATIEGKHALKQQLITQINTALGYEGIINIYFTEFVIQ